jgi:Putative DNA-binding domain
VIPKPLNEIEWSDIEALRDSGREEDDTIEYKGSFSGGSDFLAFTDSQRIKAVEGVVREALAFLNGRGGDVLLGVREAKNDHPKIEEITPVANVVATVDRLAQSLAAVIEPTQSILGVKAVLKPGSDGNGVIVVRAPSSLRAPHRYTGNKECYIRRGRESVPMPMDEVQDVSVQRNRTRFERQTDLESLFDGFEDGVVRRERLGGTRFQIRVAYLPLALIQIDPSDDELRPLVDLSPAAFDDKGRVNIDNSYMRLSAIWRPVLRGRAQTSVRDAHDYLELIGREVRNSGCMILDVAWRHEHTVPGTSDVFQVVPISWLTDYLATTLSFVGGLTTRFPNAAPGLLCARTFASGPIHFGMDRQGRQLLPLDHGVTKIEPFEINDPNDLNLAFKQLQYDLYSLVESLPPHVLSFVAPE